LDQKGAICVAQIAASLSLSVAPIQKNVNKRLILAMNARLLKTDELRIIIRENGFNVKVMAVHIGLGVRTLQRRFTEQFQTTPKAWIRRERMNSAPPLLAEGYSNKEVAAALSYTCESNFCRDFKRHFGHAPQKFEHTQ
jgi:AraC-like DNA-binding protein